MNVTEDGGTLLWKGLAVGRPTGAGLASSFGFAGSFQTAPEKLARLLTEANVGEYSADDNGNYQRDLWEWKAPEAVLTIPTEEPVSAQR